MHGVKISITHLYSPFRTAQKISSCVKWEISWNSGGRENALRSERTMFLIRPLRRVCREKSWPGYVIWGVSREERTLILDSTRFKFNRPNQFTESLLFTRKLKFSDVRFTFCCRMFKPTRREDLYLNLRPFVNQCHRVCSICSESCVEV